MVLTAADVARLEECLTGGGVAVIPTDTVYGLACDPASEIAVRRIYELKRRPPFKSAAVIFFALAPALQALSARLGPRTRAALDTLLPGPLTLLLPNPAGLYPLAGNPIPSESSSGGAGAGELPAGEACLLGVRVPALAGPLGALAAIAAPALQSSANFSGESDPCRLSDVPIELRSGADLVIDGGELPGSASTVVDLGEYERTGRWLIVREGPVGREELARKLHMVRHSKVQQH